MLKNASKQIFSLRLSFATKFNHSSKQKNIKFKNNLESSRFFAIFLKTNYGQQNLIFRLIYKFSQQKDSKINQQKQKQHLLATAAFYADSDKNLSQALSILLSITQKDQLWYPSQFVRGCIYIRLKDFNQAKKHLQNALNNSGLRPEIYINLGECQSALGNEQKANQFYDKAINLNPNNSSFHHKKAISCHNYFRLQQAYYHYKKAHELQPNDLLVIENIANCYYLDRKMQEAIKWFDKVLAKKPNQLDCIFFRNQSLMQLNRYKQALQSYEKHILSKPNYANYLNFGICYASLNNMEKAQQCFNKALKYHPNGLQAKQGLKIIKQKKGK